MERIKSHFNIKLFENITLSISLLSLVLLMLVQLTWPYDIDQLLFATVGEVILNGGMPYKDAWELKGPAVFYIIACINWIVDNKEYGLRVFDLICASFGFFIFYKICSKLSDSFTAIFLVSVFGSYYFQDNWVAAEPDGWASFLVMLMVYILLNDNNNLKNRNTIYMGFIIALLTCLKPPFVLFSLLVPIYAFLSDHTSNKERIVFITKTATVSVVLLFLVALFFWTNAALEELINILFIYNIEFHRDIWGITSEKNIITGSTRIFTLDNFIALSPLFLIGVFLSFKLDIKRSILLFSYLCISIAILIIQNSYLEYQHLILVPPVLFFASVALNKSNNKIVIYSLCLMVLYLCYHDKYPKYFFNAYKLYTNEISAEEYRDRVNLRNDRQIWEVVKYLNITNKEKRPVFVLGFEQGINFFSGNPIATRFIYNMPFIESDGEYYKKISKTLLDDLSKSKPKFIITSPYTQYISIKTRNKIEPIDRIEGLKSFIENNYEMNNIIYPFFLYKEKNTLNITK